LYRLEIYQPFNLFFLKKTFYICCSLQPMKKSSITSVSAPTDVISTLTL